MKRPRFLWIYDEVMVVPRGREMLQDSMDEPLTELSNDFALLDCKLESATGEVNIALRSNELSGHTLGDTALSLSCY